MGELTNGHAVETLEGMASNHGSVSVIYQRSMKRRQVRQSRGKIVQLNCEVDLNLQATHVNCFYQERVWESLFLIFLGLSEPR